MQLDPTLLLILVLACVAAALVMAWRHHEQLTEIRAELGSYAERVAALPIRRPRGRPPLPAVPGAPPAKKRPHRKKVNTQASLGLAPQAAAPAAPPVDNLSTAAG